MKPISLYFGCTVRLKHHLLLKKHELKQVFYSGAYSRVKILDCPIQDQCQILRHIAMNCEFGMQTKIGESFIVILVGDVFHKTTQATPDDIMETCKKRLGKYDKDMEI
jgi:predicted MPP superfamily phosphohydrolase